MNVVIVVVIAVVVVIVAAAIVVVDDGDNFNYLTPGHWSPLENMTEGNKPYESRCELDLNPQLGGLPRYLSNSATVL